MVHRKWSLFGAGAESMEGAMREHNELYDEWKASERRVMETLDENNRLDRELDEARQAQDNLIFQRNDFRHWHMNEQKKVADLTAELDAARKRIAELEAPIRVPFSDEQIERMAKAYYEARWDTGKWARLSPNDQASTKSAIRAALAAGGLEPCAVPDYDPDDVALAPRGHVLRNRLVEAEAKIERQRAELKRLNAMVAELRAQPSSDTGQLPADQVEALARVLNDAYQPIDGDNPISRAAGTHWPRMARAAIAHLAKRPEGLPTAEEMHRAWMDSPDKMSSLEWCRWSLDYLRHWLRDPVGFELDVTAKQMMELYYEKGHALPSMQAVLDLCRSRIRPVYECKECAKAEAECRQWRNANNELVRRATAARAALEGE